MQGAGPRARLFILGILLTCLILLCGCEKCSSVADKSDHAALWRGRAPSCEGLPATCGASGNDDCCKSLKVPGGTFYRGYDGIDFLSREHPATVSDFYLDKYEITVGRLRAFINAGMGTREHPPKEGAGAHPKIPGSGWQSKWNAELPADTAAAKAALKCSALRQTWTDLPGSDENKAADCLDWYTAFAFCIWDGGRLATEAEWHYAASGGSEQRYFPWSNPPTSKVFDTSFAVFSPDDGHGDPCLMKEVGLKSPKGDARWGHSDLAGNAWEWTFDWAEGPYPMPCNDCAGMNENGGYRTYRGGSSFEVSAALRSCDRHIYPPGIRFIVGSRCAGNP